ncbi:MAG: flippase-like domain-containing protein [Bacteroidales bacterium]|nr:flippase-like domain-containing protein [Bacteroidales bacterium]MBN2698537.1 flippase-like domain-containing protein [Bacteroidales bacterium]
MKKAIIQILKISGFAGLGILLLYFAFRDIELDELLNIIKNANFWWVGASLLFLTLSFISRARRWVLLIEPLNFKPSLRNTFYALMVGYLANYALPRLGEVTRCVTLGKKEKIPVDSLFGTVIIERVFDLLMLILILLLLLFTWLEKFGGFFHDQLYIPFQEKIIKAFGETYLFWAIIAAFLTVILILIYVFRKSLLKLKFFQKIRDLLKGVFLGLKTVYRMKRNWEFIFHTVFIWFCNIMMTWVLVFSLKETSHLVFIDGVFLLVVGGIAFVAPVTGGFGAYHWMVSRALYFVYGLTLEQGGAYAILTHEANSLYTILLGAISFAIILSSNKKRQYSHA